MFNRSLRAVFRKVSWMFCAGLLLSIADLLNFNLRENLPRAHASSGQANATACSWRPSGLEEHGGTTCLLTASDFARLCRLAGSWEYDTASSPAFQPGSCRN